MFARFKDPEGRNVAVIPYKVAAVFEIDMQKQVEDSETPETKVVTAISLDSGAVLYVSDSERAVRSRLEKIANNGGQVLPETDTGGESASVEA